MYLHMHDQNKARNLELEQPVKQELLFLDKQ